MSQQPAIESGNNYPPRREALLVLFVTFVAFASVSLLGELAVGKVQILLGEVFILLPAYVYARWKRYAPALIFRLRRVGWRIIAASVMIGMAMTIVADELDRLMGLLLPFPEELAALLNQLLMARSLSDWALILLGAVFLAGLFEEMLFRGFLQNSFEQHYDVTRAILLTALLFAVIHFNPWWIVQIVVLGVILGVMAWKSDSIIPGAIVHAINNGISVVLINVPENKLELLAWRGHVHPLLLLAAVAALVLGMRLFYQFCEEEAEISTLLNTPLS